MTKEDFTVLLQNLPSLPGIYKYYSNDELIYVGKAKNIKKRVQSYFQKNHTSNKTNLLVKSIQSIDFTITNTERDALLLENSLIKEFQPKYNISLKDDKTYPWIVVKNELFPRVFFTRQKKEDNAEYFGPYTSLNSAREVLHLIKSNFSLRTCKLNLSEKEINKNKYKVCLEFHLGNCKGPCVKKQSLMEYNADVEQIKNFLKGNLQSVVKHFKEQMSLYALQLEFEKAAILKQKINELQNYSIKSEVVNIKIGDADVFAIKKVEDVAIVNYLIIQDNAIVNSHNQIIHLYGDETEIEILQTVIPFLQQKFSSINKEIILKDALPIEFENYKVTIPKGGDKKKLLDFSTKNCLYQLNELLRNRRKNEKEEYSAEQLLIDLQHDLQLSVTPYHIECFDNSNFQGTNAVSAMVCFKNGIASKKDYRHYNVKTVTGIDDFATMKEVVYRRYKRLLDEKEALPQLIIIDGGKGQLSAANESIMLLGLQGKVTLIGLAKNVEEIFFVDDSESIKLPYNSKTLFLLRNIRDEVHRFGITHHRNLRSKNTFKTTLTDIEGIGKQTITILLKEFKSVNMIKQKSVTELEKIVGKSKASKISQYLNQQKK